MSVRRALFVDRIKRLRSAYRSACAPFDDELKQLEHDADVFQRRVDEGTVQWPEFDEETGLSRDYGEEFAERRQDAEDVLLLVRKAFVVAIYHLWERGAQRWVLQKNKRPRHKELVAVLTEAAIVIDEARLNELGVLANCLKHNSDDARKLYGRRRDLFTEDFDPDAILSGTGKPPRTIGWAEHVVLTDESIESYLQTIQSSGPK